MKRGVVRAGRSIESAQGDLCDLHDSPVLNNPICYRVGQAPDDSID